MAGRRQAAAAGWHGAARLGARQEGRKQQKPRLYRNRGDQVISVSGRQGGLMSAAGGREGGSRMAEEATKGGVGLGMLGRGRGSERVSVSFVSASRRL